MKITFRVLHVLSLGIWAGASVFFYTGVALNIFDYFDGIAESPTPGLAKVDKVLTARMAGDLIATIFPVYFGLQCICGVIAAATAWKISAGSVKLQRIRAILLSVLCVVVFVHVATLYRQSTIIRAEKYAALDAGNQEEFKRLNKKFFSLHGPSLLIDLSTNILVLVALGLLAPAIQGRSEGSASVDRHDSRTPS